MAGITITRKLRSRADGTAKRRPLVTHDAREQLLEPTLRTHRMHCGREMACDENGPFTLNGPQCRHFAKARTPRRVEITARRPRSSIGDAHRDRSTRARACRRLR